MGGKEGERSKKEIIMATKKESATNITIPAIDIRMVTFKVVGDTPLIMHAWDPKTKQQMLDKMMKKPVAKERETRNPVKDFIMSMYWLDGAPTEYTEEAFETAIKSGKAKFGFPAVALKKSAASAGYRAGITKDRVSMYGAFHIDGEFVEIKGIPKMREDMVRVDNGAADIRYRGEFPEWAAEITAKYNAGVVSEAQVVNLFNIGGFACGIGEWRAEKGGSYGMYHVE